MIPKIIHYCWLSNDPIPDDLKSCMDSWKKYLPDYEFMFWNFERFPKEKSKWVSDELIIRNMHLLRIIFVFMPCIIMVAFILIWMWKW